MLDEQSLIGASMEHGVAYAFMHGREQREGINIIDHSLLTQDFIANTYNE